MSVRPAQVDVLHDDPTRTDRSWLLARHRSAWRAPLIAAGLVTTAAHVPVTGEHLREAPYIGVLFILLELASVVLAIAVVRRPTRAILLAIAAVGALAVLALVLSRTVGLPLIGDDVGNWAEPLAVISLVSESIMVVGGTIAALGHAAPTRRALVAGVIGGILILGAGAVSTGLAATAAAAEHASHRMEHGGDMEGMDMGLPAAAHSNG